MFKFRRESRGESNSETILSFMVLKLKMADPRTFKVKPGTLQTTFPPRVWYP